MGEGKVADIIRRAQMGDLDAFAALYDNLAKSAYYLSYKLVQNEEDAKDIVQESMLELFEAINTLKQPAALKSFLNRVLYHNSMDLLRKRQRNNIVIDSEEVMSTIESNDMGPEEYLEQQEYQTEIHHLIDELSPDQKMVVLMFYFEHMSIREIAVSLEIKEAAVKNRLTRARASLRQKMKTEKTSIGQMFAGLFFFPFGIRKFLQEEADTLFTHRIGAEIWGGIEPTLQRVSLAPVAPDALYMVSNVPFYENPTVRIAAGTIAAGLLIAVAGGVLTPPERELEAPIPPQTEEVQEEAGEYKPPLEEAAEHQEETQYHGEEAEMPIDEPHEVTEPDEQSEANEQLPPTERPDNNSHTTSVLPEIQLQARNLQYPSGIALSTEMILTDCGASLTQELGNTITVNGLDSISTTEAGQYAVFLTVEGRDDISSKVVTITIYSEESND